MQAELILITTHLMWVGQAVQICVQRPVKPAVLPMRPHSRMPPPPPAHSLLHLHFHGCTSLALLVALLGSLGISTSSARLGAAAQKRGGDEGKCCDELSPHLSIRGVSSCLHQLAALRQEAG